MKIFECLGTFKENNITVKIMQKIKKNYLTFSGKNKGERGPRDYNIHKKH